MLTLDVDGQPVWAPAVLLLGVLVGYVAGLFGVGGGFLLTPLLVAAFRVPLAVAVGTGLCQIIGTAVASLLRHQRLRQGEGRFDLLMLPGSLLGAQLGARLLAALGPGGRAAAVIDLGYVTVLLLSAAVFWRQRTSPAASAPVPGPLARLRLGLPIDLPAVPLRGVSAVGIAYLGLALGVLSGLLGIGGGVALMPVLLYGYGFPMRQAAGTGILALLVSAASGTLTHARQGHVHLGLAMVLLLGSTVSAQFGALATQRLSPAALRRAFAGVSLAAVLAVLWDLWRRLRG